MKLIEAYREITLEGRHYELYKRLIDKPKEERKESEERFIRTYQALIRQNFSIFLVIIVLLGMIVAATLWVFFKLVLKG